MENEIDAQEVIETPEMVEETIETPEESPEDIVARLEKEKSELEEKNKKLYARLKKADEPKEKNDNLSSKDVLFLAKANVHDDDLDDVLEWAKFKKITVADAYNQLKATLDVRNEERRTASATVTRGGARGTSKVSGEELLTRAERTGEVPESAEGMQALFLARQARRLKK